MKTRTFFTHPDHQVERIAYINEAKRPRQARRIPTVTPAVPRPATSSPTLHDNVFFLPASYFNGYKRGFVFKSGPKGVGYYRDMFQVEVGRVGDDGGRNGGGRARDNGEGGGDGRPDARRNVRVSCWVSTGDSDKLIVLKGDTNRWY